MRHSYRMTAVAGIVAAGIAASVYASPWFGTSHNQKDAAPVASHSADLKESAITYLNELCELPKEQRDESFREVNEALLPNHATLSCGARGEQ